MNTAFYKDKKVFITGHTGFKGSWLSLWLCGAGAKVTGYSLPPPTEPSMFNLCCIADHMHSITGDVRDGSSLAPALEQAQPDLVFHLAAQPIVRLSYIHPAETYETNVMGTVNLLEAVRRVPSVRAVVVVTSDKCYENVEQARKLYREEDRLGGYDPYSSSKACQELVTSAYEKSFFNAENYPEHRTAVASARAGNVIGGGDFAQDRLLPDFIKAIHHNRDLEIRNPHATRPWQFVLEPLRGYLRLAEKLYTDGPEYSGAWNFGPEEGQSKTVEWIVDRLYGILGKAPGYTVKVNLNESTKLHEAAYLGIDCSKARNKLNISPRLNIEQSLQFTCDWAKAYFSGENMLAFTMKQIEAYESISQE